MPAKLARHPQRLRRPPRPKHASPPPRFGAVALHALHQIAYEYGVSALGIRTCRIPSVIDHADDGGRGGPIDRAGKSRKNLSTVHGPWTDVFRRTMKSQDIFLLLKLAALERQAEPATAAPSKPSNDFAADIAPKHETAEEDAGSMLPFTSNLELDPYSVRGLSSATGISKSEISNALGRCYASGLAKPQRQGSGPVVNRRALEEFLSHGVRFVFPAQTLGLARGIPTGLTAPIFEGILRNAGEHSPVWPDPRGDTLGLAVEPLYKTVTTAIRDDETLYKLLAIVDSIRLGQPRERKLAIAQLHGLLNF